MSTTSVTNQILVLALPFEASTYYPPKNSRICAPSERICADSDYCWRFCISVLQICCFAEEGDLGYYQSVSAKETHVYNPFTLSSKNWKFRGVFSRELWQDRDEVIERLVRFSNYLE